MPMSNDCAAEEILLWIHKGRVVTVWSSVLWSDRVDLCLRNHSDKSMQNMSGSRGPGYSGVRWREIALERQGATGDVIDHSSYIVSPCRCLSKSLI